MCGHVYFNLTSMRQYRDLCFEEIRLRHLESKKEEKIEIPKCSWMEIESTFSNEIKMKSYFRKTVDVSSKTTILFPNEGIEFCTRKGLKRTCLINDVGRSHERLKMFQALNPPHDISVRFKPKWIFEQNTINKDKIKVFLLDRQKENLDNLKRRVNLILSQEKNFYSFSRKSSDVYAKKLEVFLRSEIVILSNIKIESNVYKVDESLDETSLLKRFHKKYKPVIYTKNIPKNENTLLMWVEYRDFEEKLDNAIIFHGIGIVDFIVPHHINEVKRVNMPQDFNRYRNFKALDFSIDEKQTVQRNLESYDKLRSIEIKFSKCFVSVNFLEPLFAEVLNEEKGAGVLCNIILFLELKDVYRSVTFVCKALHKSCEFVLYNLKVFQEIEYRWMLDVFRNVKCELNGNILRKLLSNKSFSSLMRIENREKVFYKRLGVDVKSFENFFRYRQKLDKFCLYGIYLRKGYAKGFDLVTLKEIINRIDPNIPNYFDIGEYVNNFLLMKRSDGSQKFQKSDYDVDSEVVKTIFECVKKKENKEENDEFLMDAARVVFKMKESFYGVNFELFYSIFEMKRLLDEKLLNTELNLLKRGKYKEILSMLGLLCTSCRFMLLDADISKTIEYFKFFEEYLTCLKNVEETRIIKYLLRFLIFKGKVRVMKYLFSDSSKLNCIDLLLNSLPSTTEDGEICFAVVFLNIRVGLNEELLEYYEILSKFMNRVYEDVRIGISDKYELIYEMFCNVLKTKAMKEAVNDCQDIADEILKRGFENIESFNHFLYDDYMYGGNEMEIFNREMVVKMIVKNKRFQYEIEFFFVDYTTSQKKASKIKYLGLCEENVVCLIFFDKFEFYRKSVGLEKIINFWVSSYMLEGLKRTVELHPESLTKKCCMMILDEMLFSLRDIPSIFHITTRWFCFYVIKFLEEKDIFNKYFVNDMKYKKVILFISVYVDKKLKFLCTKLIGKKKLLFDSNFIRFSIIDILTNEPYMQILRRIYYSDIDDELINFIFVMSCQYINRKHSREFLKTIIHFLSVNEIKKRIKQENLKCINKSVCKISNLDSILSMSEKASVKKLMEKLNTLLY